MTHQLGLALRRLRDTPGFTAIAVASLAFAMGLNVLIFSFTSPVLFKALPYPEPDRLLDVSMAPPGKPESKGVVTPGLYLLLRDKTSAAFEAVGAFDAGRSANLAGDASGPAERLDGHRISATGLAALGATPLLGRLPLAADEQAGARAHHSAQLPGLAATLRRPCGRGRPDRKGRWTANPDSWSHAGGLRPPRQFFRRLFRVPPRRPSVMIMETPRARQTTARSAQSLICLGTSMSSAIHAVNRLLACIAAGR